MFRLRHSKPESVAIRRLLLMPSGRGVPCRSDDLTDSPNSRDRALSIITRHAHAISDTVQELAT